MNELKLDLPFDLVMQMAETAARSPITIPQPDDTGLSSVPPVLWERHIRVEWGVAKQPRIPGPGPGGYRDIIGEIMYANEFEWYHPKGLKRYMEFEASVERGGTSNTATLSVWNIGEGTLNLYYEALKAAGVAAERAQPVAGNEEAEFDAVSEEVEISSGFVPYVRVYAGWGEWVPLIFTGKVKVIPETEWNKADKITKFQLSDDEFSILPRWRCPGTDGGEFPPGTMKSEIVKRLIDELRIPLGREIELGVDYPIKSGQSLSADKTVREQLGNEAKETNSTFYVLNSKLYFVPTSYGLQTDLVLNKKTGLVWSSRPIHQPQWGGTEEIVFNSMLNPMLNLDAIIRIEDHSFNGDVRISAVHTKIARQEYYCECRAEIFDRDEAMALREQHLLSKLEILNRERKGINPLIRVPGEFRLVEGESEAPPVERPRPRPALPVIPDWIWDTIDGRWRTQPPD